MSPTFTHAVLLFRRSAPVPMIVAVAMLSVASCSRLTGWNTASQAVRRWTTDHQWLTDFESAERRARESDRPMLIVYRSGIAKADKNMDQALQSPSLRGKMQDYVRCDLFRLRESDRRYAAQFGVERPGSMMVVHRDGTYHARSGLLSSEDIERFLAGAKPPGAQPRWDANIVRYAACSWHDSLDDARAVAEQTKKPIFHVVERHLRGDCRKLDKLLNRPEVVRRLIGMVHCRTTVWNPLAKTADTPCGSVRLPAVMLIRPDGTCRVLEMPQSYESLVRFVDENAGSFIPQSWWDTKTSRGSTPVVEAEPRRVSSKPDAGSR